MMKLLVLLTLSLSLNLAQAQKLGSNENFIQKNRRYYPEQTSDFIIQRLQNCNNVHDFIRSFIPFFYERLNLLSKDFRNYQNLKGYKGLALGDAHIENFGFLTADTNKLLFGFNDLDDVAKAPYVVDLYRHFTSSTLANVDVNLSEYIKYYQLGLKEEKYIYGRAFEILKEDAIADLGKLSKKYVDTETKKFKAYLGGKEEVSLISKTEQAQFKKILDHEFNKKYEIFDAYRFYKTTGGSAGVDRIELLVELDKKLEWIELKEQQSSGLKSLNEAIVLSDSVKIEHVNKIFFEKQLSESFKMIRHKSKVYLARYRKSSNKGIELSDVADKDREKLIYDEVYTLGRIHALSLKNPVKTNLVNSLENIDLKEFEKETKTIINQIKEDYRNAKDEI